MTINKLMFASNQDQDLGDEGFRHKIIQIHIPLSHKWKFRGHTIERVHETDNVRSLKTSPSRSLTDRKKSSKKLGTGYDWR